MSATPLYRGIVTGLSYYAYGRLFNSLKTGELVQLERHAHSEHDDKAIKVLFEDLQIGWIPRAQNQELAKYMDASGLASMVGVITNHIPGYAFDQRLYIQVYANEVPKQGTEEMTIIAKALEANKQTAVSASFLEAGRIANNQIAMLLAKKAPMMVRGYVDTPVGKLVVANVATLAAEQFRSNDPKLKKLTQAMMVQAYQELIQELDIEGYIDALLNDGKIKQALNKLGKSEAAE
jgi:hypothetical protein